MKNCEDFMVSSNICSNCLILQHGDEENEAGLLSEKTCKTCRTWLPVDKKIRNNLWKRQLELFLNFKSNDQLGGENSVVVMYSGGTDSSLSLLLARQLGLNPIAVRLKFGWDREIIDEIVEEFCSRQEIPCITLSIDTKSMFLRCHDNIEEVSDVELLSFPWCELCSDGDHNFCRWTHGPIAKLLHVKRFVVGNNWGFLEPDKIKRDHFTHNNAIGRLVLNNWELFETGSIPTVLSAENDNDLISICLPAACGISQEEKKRILKTNGFQLPESFFRTPGSECQLALVLPCAYRMLPFLGARPPKAGAQGEFLSGYLSRDDWVHKLLLSNSFTFSESLEAIAYLRESITKHQTQEEVSVELNNVFMKKYPDFNGDGFRSQLIRMAKEEKLKKEQAIASNNNISYHASSRGTISIKDTRVFYSEGVEHEFELNELESEVYKYCEQYRSFNDICDNFSSVATNQLWRVINGFLQFGIFKQRERLRKIEYLALAKRRDISEDHR